MEDFTRISAPEESMDDGGIRAFGVDGAAQLWNLYVTATGATFDHSMNAQGSGVARPAPRHPWWTCQCAGDQRRLYDST
ncbi:hypothetical protein [Streptomyces chartreusis]|uniref:hypothetical protein n=1 Tax=Streptomyces chartreusis TaxID=1969 RepID=UPI00344A0B90